jgi:hypothetical protein
MLQNTEVVFGFELSDKAVHWSFPQEGWTFRKRKLRNVAIKSVEPLSLALIYMSRKCEHLEQIKIQGANVFHDP